MNLADLLTELKTLKLPVAYGEFIGTKEQPAPAPPFITVQFAYGSDMMADNHNYVDIGNYQVELYTIKKDTATERRVQDLLKQLRLPYSRVETKLETEKLYQMIYNIKLIGG